MKNIDTIREALEFYARKETYEVERQGDEFGGMEWLPIEDDKGERARNALEALTRLSTPAQPNEKFKPTYEELRDILAAQYTANVPVNEHGHVKIPYFVDRQVEDLIERFPNLLSEPKTTPSTSAEGVERVARGLAAHAYEGAEGYCSQWKNSEEFCDREWRFYISEAKVALAAMKGVGEYRAVIYDTKHCAYWREDAKGYTLDKAEAGLFGLREIAERNEKLTCRRLVALPPPPNVKKYEPAHLSIQETGDSEHTRILPAAPRKGE